MSEGTRERSFDELAKGLAGGTVSRRKALRLMGAALVGGALASFPGAAWAAKGGGGGKSACAKYCKTLFGGDTAAQEECVSQGAQGTGPCFACGGPAKPAPTCSGTQTLNSETCQCEEEEGGGGVPDLCSGVACGTCTQPDGGTVSCSCAPLAWGAGTVCYSSGDFGFGSQLCPYEGCADPGTVCIQFDTGVRGCVYPCVDGEPCAVL